jgi:hypothetical protein
MQAVGALLLGGSKAKARLGMISVVVLLRTLLQDRIARLNGRSVDYVLRQDRPAFVRLIGLSVLQVRSYLDFLAPRVDCHLERIVPITGLITQMFAVDLFTYLFHLTRIACPFASCCGQWSVGSGPYIRLRFAEVPPPFLY